MAAYPTLATEPEKPLGEDREDSVLRSKFEAGYENTRQRFTRIRRMWSVKYKLLPASDKDILTTFIDDTVKGGADMFDWTHPVTSIVHSVRFEKPPVFTLIKFGAEAYYDTNFTLNEV